MPNVLNVRKLGKQLDPETQVYVGRPSKFGNPFMVGKHGTRREVIQKYREWLLTQPELMAALPTLRGKDLVCWCAPEACHAAVLIELANGESDEHGGS